MTAPPASATPTIRGSCGKAVGPFSVRGTQVLDGSGHAGGSFGSTVPGLQVGNWQNQVQMDLAKIAATASDWCANTVRLQVSQDNLLGPNGTGYNKSFMAAIKSEVAAAERDQLVVVLNDTTEFTAPGGPGTEMEPTPATETFWKDMTGEWTNYEPAPTSHPTGPRSSCWPDAPSVVPEYLRFLASLDVGLNAYQLQPGLLIKSYSDLGDPTTINSRTWSCTSNAEAQPGQGVGYLLLSWFEQRND